MHLLTLILYVWAGKIRCKVPWKILICSSASFQTWACPVIKILSKNDRLRALLQLFVAMGCRNASYHQWRCFCFPYLRRKEVSSHLWTNWGFVPFSDCNWKIPLTLWGTWVRGSRGCRVTWESRFISLLIRSQRHFHSNNNVELVELCWPHVLDDSSGFCRTFFSDC